MRSRRLILFLCLATSLGACTKSFETDSTSAASAPESAYCGAPKTISGATSTVTGSAHFKFRRLLNGSTEQGTSWYLDYTLSNVEIPFAEFHVLDSGGNIIQCGETDTNGNFSFSVPSSGTFTLQVLSRAYNSNYKVSVLKDITLNQPYAINKTFSAGGSVNVGSIFAEADETVDSEIPGGAFNIMYNILMANEFLANEANIPGFTGAPKVTVYWKAGFNPYSYFGAPGNPLSFYRPDYRELYILGGMNGDVIKADTDHFDDSVILHEYGHFLEDVYGKSNTPGGSHNGNAIIDPRLAWSEGWANYFQAQVKTSATVPPASASLYIDTYGHKSDSSDTTGFGQAVLFGLKEVPPSASLDNPGFDKEGNYREVSVSRTLYKTTFVGSYSSSPARTGGSIPFRYVWQAFGEGDSSGSPTIDGFHSPNLNFRNFGLFNASLDAILVRHGVSRTDWNVALTDEMQPADTSSYGAKVTVGGSCPQTMQAVANSSSGLNAYCLATNPSTGSCTSVAHKSNQLRSNAFYTYCYDGATNPSVNLRVSSQTTPNKVGLDLYIYSPDYIYFEEVLGLFGQTSPYVLRKNIAPTADNSTKSVSLSGLPAGCYMINVRANTVNANGTDKLTSDLSGTVNYHLTTDGGYLCP